MSECAVLGCKPEPGASVHHLPRNPVLKQKWMDFIYKRRLSRPSNTVGIRICCAHFSDDCFENFFQRSMGFAKKLILKPGAVPCIYPGNSNVLKHKAGASCLKRAHVASQCSLPAIKTRTVGTQLSERRLIYRRSVGVQTRLPTSGAGVGKIEARSAEQSKGRIISTSQKPPPSLLIEWSLPEIEDDDRCVTVVTQFLLKSLSLTEESSIVVTTMLQELWTENLRFKLLSRPSV